MEVEGWGFDLTNILLILKKNDVLNSELWCRFVGETQPGLVTCKDAAKKLIDLGLVFTPLEVAIQDTVESLRSKGFLNQWVIKTNQNNFSYSFWMQIDASLSIFMNK